MFIIKEWELSYSSLKRLENITAGGKFRRVAIRGWGVFAIDPPSGVLIYVANVSVLHNQNVC